VGILAGAFGGATLAKALAAHLRYFPWLAPYSDATALGIVVVGITYFTLVLGELVPKRLALYHPEGIAAAIAAPMRLLSRITAPVVHILSTSTEAVLRISGIRPSAEPPVTEEEIIVLIEQGTQAGMFEKAESNMIESIFRLGDRRADALMTPRTEVVWLDVDDPPEDIRRKITESVHSRFVVAQGSLDTVLGVVLAKDLLTRSLAGEPVDLRAALHEPLFVPESIGALRVLELFKQSGVQLALVIDEYGGLQGLVTLNDILEAIVGEIGVAGAPSEPQVVQREDGSWLIDGMLPMDEITELFHLREVPIEERGVYQTLGGFVMMHLGRIPSAADHFEWNGLRFEVVDMDGYRVDKVLIEPMRPPPSEPIDGTDVEE
jgi:putative hemolysin